MKRKGIIVGVLFVVLMVGLYVGDLLNQRNKAKCDCVFPNSGRYGVIDEKGVCRVSDCAVVAEKGRE
jgi:hypothetical protein